MDYLSSMYIDNEMDLDEKRRFVEKVRTDDSFYNQTLELLYQEKQLRELPVVQDGIAGRGEQMGIFGDGNPYVALGKRPGIVQPVSYHGHLLSFLLQFPDKMQFFPGGLVEVHGGQRR